VWQIPKDLKTNRLLVLAWTGHFFGADYLDDQLIPNPHGADIELKFTHDRERLDEVDAVWFHAPSITDLPPRKRQPWILMSMESEVNYPALKNPIVRLRFDLAMTYRLDADIPCIYPNWRHYGDFMEPPPIRREPSADALAVYIASNPVKHRDNYVAELMRHIRIDSLGACLNNADIDGFVRGGWSDGAWSSLMEVLPRYKFYLAFENSIAADYVTERVFHALVRGVVPVYRGAPNVREWMPDDDALIDASDFASARELADYLRQLDRDDTAYAKHLRWKYDGYSDRFRRLVDLGSIDPMWRMAVKLAHGCGHDCRCGGRLRGGAAP
jgi:hypothetical protein